MSQLLHHVPGRLRVKIPAIKGNSDQARQLVARLEVRAGVVAARANPVTGSLVIQYDVRQAGPETILAGLRAEGIVCAGEVPSSTSASGANLSSRLGDKVVDKFIESLVERSAVALIAALV